MDIIKTMAAKRAKFFRLVINGANLGHFEAEVGINGREAANVLKINNKLFKSRAFWIEMGRGGGHSPMSPWLRTCK